MTYKNPESSQPPVAQGKDMVPRILVIDDEESMCNFMEIMLSKAGYEVDVTTSGREGVDRLRQTNYDLVIADLNMPELSGLEVLQEVKSFKSEQEIIVMTAFASVDSAIEAMKKGAADYVTKPFKVDEIKLAIDKSISRKSLLNENATLKKQLQGNNSFDNFIGTCEAVVELKKLSRRIASSDSTVLIRGESGTGKDVVARAIHHHSPRCGGPFVTINCAALPEPLLESELFGHVRGAFTGAVANKDGLLRQAHGGTIFLDEIGKTTLAMQGKLLQFLDTGKVRRVGSNEMIPVDVKVICASKIDLLKLCEEGRFLEDFYYRINDFPLEVPPLRKRKDDIPLLLEYYLEKVATEMGKIITGISPEAMDKLVSYRWPGNVRELEKVVKRAVILADDGDEIGLEHLPPVVLDYSASASDERTSKLTLKEKICELEKREILDALKRNAWNRSRAATELGISYPNLLSKIKTYRLQ